MAVTRKSSGGSWLLQGLCLAALVAAFAFIAHNTVLNLAARGIASGFAFLGRPAGFDIAFSLLPYGEGSTFATAFAVGLCNTLLVAVLSIAMASGLGLLLALLRLSRNPLLRWIGAVYVETVRNIPLLLQLFFWYFAVLRQLPPPRQSLTAGSGIVLNIRGLYLAYPEERSAVLYLIALMLAGLVLGHLLRSLALKRKKESGHFPRWQHAPFLLPILMPALSFLLCDWTLDIPRLEGFNYVGGLQLIPELLALLVALSIYTAAFIGEIIRAGILSVAPGQREAAQALGLSGFDTLRLIILPQALRVIVPPLTSQYLNVTKNSSLAAAIAFPDLVLIFAGTTLNVTGQAVEIMALTLLTYLLLCLAISWAMHLFQRRVLHVDN